MEDLFTDTSAVDELIGRDEEGRWVDEFRYGGRVYTIRQGVGATFYPGRAVFPVWNERGQATRVMVRDSAPVEVLSRL